MLQFLFFVILFAFLIFTDSLSLNTHSISGITRHNTISNKISSISAKRRTIIGKNRNQDQSIDESESQSSTNEFQSINQLNIKHIDKEERQRQIASLLEDDISEFQRNSITSTTSTSNNETTPLNIIKNIISTFLIADFFVVIVFLLWFLAAVVTKSSNPYLLERFQDIFNPIVVPSLTILMAGSIASGLFNNDKKDK